MFEKLTTAEEIYSFKLGAALTMERTTLDMLADLEDHAQRDDLKRLFREHATETKQHVANVERAFQMLGEDSTARRAPPSRGSRRRARRPSRRPMIASSTRCCSRAPTRPSTTRSPSTRR
jgi:hypothetical protein